jgi:hypothetical protein
MKSCAKKNQDASLIARECGSQRDAGRACDLVPYLTLIRSPLA